MTNRFEQRVALITGGASGIGLATARRLLAEGANVLIADINEASAEQAGKVLTELSNSQRVQVSIADAANDDDIAGCYQQALQRWGRIDIACLNAGIGGAFGPIEEVETTHWDETFAMLVRSVFIGIRCAVEPMSQRGGGSIIATSSVAGLSGGAAGHAYSAAKAAVVNLARSAAIELASHRIRVNTVAPGLIATPLVQRTDETVMERHLDKQPWPVSGQPEDIAATIAFLASPDAGFITGTTITVDGGLTAHGAKIWDYERMFTKGKSGFFPGSTGREPTMNNPASAD